LLNYPAITIPLIVVGIILYVLYRRQNAGGPTSGAYPPAMAPMAGMARQDVLQGLHQHDPAFDDQAFFQRVNTAFVKIQDAWCRQKLSEVRPFISDGVHERFTLQFAEQKSQGWRDQLDNLRVINIAFAEFETDGLFDELSVKIHAAARDYRVSLADGKPAPGPSVPNEFVEIWSFLRRRGALTQAGRPGLIEGQCPNCGAPIELNQSANCTHCKALLRSGEYDWVLSEITQAEEWQGTRHDNVPGADALRARDPGFNAVEMEDRASVLFWRKATADRVARIDPLRKMATDDFCQKYAPTLRPGADGERQFFMDCAVGSVQLRGVSSDARGDRGMIEIRWTGTRVAAAAGKPLRMIARDQLTYSQFVLWRQPGAATDAGKGISSAHCPNCGAPASDSAANACEFCGAVLNDGAHGWALVDIHDRSVPQGG
ncbi:MAG TPA: transporter, partial [Tepidisphaeraceae bacterium]|nr:transporter [Tepidisphaeraceae bacterium]